MANDISKIKTPDGVVHDLKALSVKDSYNGTATTFAYSKEGLASATWLAAWSGYEVRAISPANITAGRASALYGPIDQAITATAGDRTLAFYPRVPKSTAGLFPAPDNANAVITFYKHEGNYYSQLGFNNNGEIYYRSFNNTAINTTTAWTKILTDTSSLPEAYLTWGGKNFSGNFGPLDAALDPALGANRFELMSGSKITVEYSQNGSTYYDYGADEITRRGLFSAGGVGGFRIGKVTSSHTVNDRLRVTVDCNGILYSVLNKIIIKASTNGSNVNWVKIEVAKYHASSPQSWITLVEKQSIGGWWGWNVINTGNFTVTSSTHADYYRWVRFTFGADVASTGSDALTIMKICAYGGMGWGTPSTFASSGHIYSWDASQNTFFPGAIYEAGTALVNKYAGISHSHTFASLTSKPTTLSDYGITDAVASADIGKVYRKYGEVKLIATLDYQRVVIGLIQIGTTQGSIDYNNSFDGIIIARRTNALLSQYRADVTISTSYYKYAAFASLSTNYENTNRTSANSGNGYRLCTFTYNGKVYAGIEAYKDQAVGYYYKGTYQPGSTVEPFAVAYYTQNTSSVINSEIYNSISFTSVRNAATTFTAPTLVLDKPVTIADIEFWSKPDGGNSQIQPLMTGAAYLGTSTYPWTHTYTTNFNLGIASENINTYKNNNTLSGLVFRTTDGFIRHTSLANFQTLIGSSLLPTATDTVKGGIYLGHTDGANEAAVVLDDYEMAYVENVVKTTVLDVTTGSSSSSKPIHLKADDLALVTDGWKKLGGKTSQAALTITTPTEGTCPAWIASAYAGTILFGTRDVHGYVSTAYNGATFTIGGGSTGNSTDSAPMWYMKFTGTNGATYNLANFLTSAITSDVTLATGKTIRPAAATNACSLGTSSYKWNNAHINTLTIYENINLPFENGGILTYDPDSGLDIDTTAYATAAHKHGMTSANDMIIGGSGGTPTRLAKGSNNTFLGINSSGNIAWGTPGGTASGHAHTLKITNASGTTITNLAPYTLYTLYAGNSTMQFRTPYDTTCLAEGTKILMADNSEKSIEDVVAGDIIMSYDPNTEKLCEAVIIDNIPTGRSDDFVNYYFDDGSFLSIFGKHCIYSADEGTARGVDYWEPGWKTIAADGKEVMYIGSENVHNAGRKRHFDLHSSNKLYFANGILNAQSLTLDYPLYKDDGLPEEFITALKADFDSSANLHTHQFDKKMGSILAPILKELKAQKKVMDDNKKRLADSDYLVAKFTEGLISAAEWLKAKAERAGWRSAVNKAEPLYAAAQERYDVFKAKYAPTSTKRERFNAAVARDNACLDVLKAYYKTKNEVSK